MRYLRKINIFLSLSTIVVIFWLTCIYTWNFHSHHLPNGGIVFHSHPVNKHTDNPDPYKNHQHSEEEFFILDQLSIFYFLENVEVSFEDFRIFELPVYQNLFTQEFVDSKFHRITDLRGPPLA